MAAHRKSDRHRVASARTNLVNLSHPFIGNLIRRGRQPTDRANGKLLFSFEEVLARDQPIGARHDFMLRKPVRSFRCHCLPAFSCLPFFYSTTNDAIGFWTLLQKRTASLPSGVVVLRPGFARLTVTPHSWMQPNNGQRS